MRQSKLLAVGDSECSLASSVVGDYNSALSAVVKADIVALILLAIAATAYLFVPSHA